MKSGEFGKAVGWEKAMDAKQWAENIEKNPTFADQLVQELPKQGITKDVLEHWANWYGERFRQYPNSEQFFWRSRGLKQLKDRFPSAAPASTPSICPPGWACT
jgi:hypothetical protein